MTQNALGRLHDFALFVRSDDDLRTGLEELVQLAASVTNAASCSIMLLSEVEQSTPRLKLWASSKALPTSAWTETLAAGQSIAGRVLERGASLLVTDISASEFAPLARQRDALGPSFICSPIMIGKHVIGVINLSSQSGFRPFEPADLALADIVATLIGKCVQVERLQTLLRSRVAHVSLATQEPDVVVRLTDGTTAPARVAKLLAKSFFRDLSSAGFEAGQIIDAAAEIIALVSNDINRYQKHKRRKAQRAHIPAQG